VPERVPHGECQDVVDARLAEPVGADAAEHTATVLRELEGKAAGLASELAMRLARATVAGAGALADASPESAAQLRINVTSPAGTTAAGLAVLMPELPDLMTRTVAAAARRSRELAG